MSPEVIDETEVSSILIVGDGIVRHNPMSYQPMSGGRNRVRCVGAESVLSKRDGGWVGKEHCEAEEAGCSQMSTMRLCMLRKSSPVKLT